MNYLSVCSGVEAASVAWHSLGWNPVAFSEIEPFPSAVLTHHYPNVPNMGDMTKYKEWKLNEPIDLLVGGTPCQSFSVAGLRKGMDDPRGNLALVYLGIADKFKPKWIVWENVPGVLSSKGGRDFGSFLGALGELGYGFAYRVLDAQYFGVPQRRRRVFVVGCLGDWRSAAAVLFEQESVSRDPKKSRSKRKETSRTFIPSVANCLQTTCNDYSRADGFNMIAYENHPSDSRVKEMGDVCQTVTSTWGTGGGNIPFVGMKAYSLQGAGATSQNANGSGWNEDQSFTLNVTDVHGVATVAVDVYNQAVDGNVTATLTEACGGTNTSGPKLVSNMAVRRLTPVECERLQGFPDDYTDITWRNKTEAPDGPRYKAMGNSMAVPVMRWIGERIQMVESL